MIFQRTTSKTTFTNAASLATSVNSQEALMQQEFKAEGKDVDTKLQNHQPSYHKRTFNKLLPFEVQDTNQKHSSDPLRPRGKYYCTLDDCGKSFGTMTARDCHARLHSKFRPFKCHLCSKSYTQNMNLKKHLLKHSHPDLDVRRVFECRYCDKKFTEKYTRKTHERKFHSEAL